MAALLIWSADGKSGASGESESENRNTERRNIHAIFRTHDELCLLLLMRRSLRNLFICAVAVKICCSF